MNENVVIEDEKASSYLSQFGVFLVEEAQQKRLWGVQYLS